MKQQVQAVLWHTLTTEQVVTQLDSSKERGISNDEAASRLEEYGLNQLTEVKGISALGLLFAQLKNFLIIILICAVVLSASLGHTIEAVAIGVIVLFAVLLGFFQEYRAERAIEALRKMAAPTANVIRGGVEMTIPADSVVPGDIILLAAGDRVPADARMLESISLHADEAALTGESVPVGKHHDVITTEELSVGDRKNMVYSGTNITYGRGRAIVAATGMLTEFGRIAGMLQTVESSQTPLQKNLDRVGKTLAKAALVIVILISALGLMRGEPWLEVVIFGIALAVAVVPEALPAVVTISLAIGVQRMVKRHALIRKLPAVETLGSTTVICSDKTGTLTKDEMTVRKIYLAGDIFDVSGNGYEPSGEFSVNGKTVEPPPLLMELLLAGVLSSDATLHQEEGSWIIKGDPTEGSLIVTAAKAGLQKDGLEELYPRTAEIPFTSETKRMTTLHTVDGKTVAYAKGAPEVLLPACTQCKLTGSYTECTMDDRKKILEAARQMADASLRVLAIAEKRDTTLANAESEMTFLGLIGMIDPPRPEAKEAVAKCREAGIKTIMITGDHLATAKAIATELQILRSGRAVSGAELDHMSDAELEKAVEEIEVYARVSPEHKLKIVTALQKNGHIVAMTGDGVNDAPALKKANIGVAMGITGTDVTKEAAAMTLTDDNFASIVAAVEEGRGIFHNIKKYLMYLLSANIGEICLLTGSSVLGLPLPLTAVQILYVNLATDGLPALALAVDPPEKDIMKRAPRDPKRGIFTRPIILLMLTGGLWSMVINLGIFLWALNSGRALDEAMTFVFVSLVLTEFFKAYAFRSDVHSILRKPFTNKWLNISVAWELGLLLLIIYVPYLQHPFKTVHLDTMDWVRISLLAFTIIPVLEMAKWLLRRGLPQSRLAA